MPDVIHIEALEIAAFLGVPDVERSAPQRLTVSLTIEPERDFPALDDRIENSVDYALVVSAVQAVGLERPRRLLETLAEEIAARVLADFRVRSVELELRKFILPETAFVAVRLRRQR